MVGGWWSSGFLNRDFAFVHIVSKCACMWLSPWLVTTTHVNEAILNKYTNDNLFNRALIINTMDEHDLSNRVHHECIHQRDNTDAVLAIHFIRIVFSKLEDEEQSGVVLHLLRWVGIHIHSKEFKRRLSFSFTVWICNFVLSSKVMLLRHLHIKPV